MNKTYLLAAIALLTLGLGCLCLPVGIIPTGPSPIPPAFSTITTSPTLPIKTVLPVVEPTPTNPSNLAVGGPWLLIETDQGLWAANADGSGLTQLTDVDYWDLQLQKAVQPGGNQVVFLSPATYDFHKMTLNLISLPDGNITKITDLTSPETEAYAEMAPGDASEAMRAVRDQHNYAWSPDGTRLAFVGLMDGPTAEIYLYDTLSGEIQRVSTDDAQNYWPSWSPDGNSLLYFGTSAFGTGAGFDTSGFWSARGDGTNATMLYMPKSGSEKLVGWLDPRTAVLNTWTAISGNEKLRLFDITSANTIMLSEDPILSAEADPVRGMAVYAKSSGLHLLTAKDRTPVLVSQDEVKRIAPLDPGETFFSVYFKNGSLATFGTSEMDHLVSPIEAASDKLDVAMYAWIWGWTSEDESEPGVWITGPGVEIGRIFNNAARLPIWDEDNNLFFLARDEGNGYDLYRTTFDTYYRDLAAVGFIPAYVLAVTWLEGK